MSDSTPSTPPAGEQRRLAAIVFTDVVGYSARMQRDETGTMKLVATDFALMRERCAQHGGELPGLREQLRTYPLYDPLRGNPRFEALLAELKK